MRDILLFVISFICAAFVMIMHELTKALVYKDYVKKEKEKISVKGIWKLWRYIDPIGIIFAIFNYGIFSKQYPFIIKSKKATIRIAVAGMATLLLLGLFSSSIYQIIIIGIGDRIEVNNIPLYIEVTGAVLEYITYHSITLFLVNLFPLASFDITLLIAANNQKLFLIHRKYDLIIKIIFIILLVLGIFPATGLIISRFLLLI